MIMQAAYLSNTLIRIMTSLRLANEVVQSLVEIIYPYGSYMKSLVKPFKKGPTIAGLGRVPVQPLSFALG